MPTRARARAVLHVQGDVQGGDRSLRAQLVIVRTDPRYGALHGTPFPMSEFYDRARESVSRNSRNQQGKTWSCRRRLEMCSDALPASTGLARKPRAPGAR